ncbi:MAG: GNAT family N-acetyltransferase [Myxococcota bacterium]|nr:GNAT family N-acetyltransferase [Myxococcota bacterium]
MQDLPTNLYPISVLDYWSLAEKKGGRWYGCWDRTPGGESLSALAYLSSRQGGLVVPYGEPDGCRKLGEHLRDLAPCEMVIGPRESCDALWKGLGGPRSRLFFDQALYVCREVSAGPALEVREARRSESEAVARMHARMMEADLGVDPGIADPPAHMRQVCARIRSGRTLVVEKGGELVFKLDVGTLVRHGAQVGGTWVPVAHRSQGIATQAVRGVCRRLLNRVPMVTLHVNEANEAAVRCYRSAGFGRARSFRLISRS